MIVYREIHNPDEMHQAVELEKCVWGSAAISVTPANMLMAAVHSGGLLLGAELDGELIGFCFAIVGKYHNELILWSHITGVLPEYQGSGIGKALKLKQRDWALAHGYKRIHWTTDPLQRGNANFNLNRLRASAIAYSVNHYGSMADGINAGMQTDRFEIAWELNSDRVIAAVGDKNLPQFRIDTNQVLLQADANGNPVDRSPSSYSQPIYYVQIPRSITKLKQQDIRRAKAWQMGLRNTIIPAFNQGYAAVSFVDQDGRCWYVLAQMLK